MRPRTLTPEQRARRAETKKAWVAANPEKVAEYNRQYRLRTGGRWYKEWNRNNPERRRSHLLKSRFGIDLEGYNAMLDAQGGACAICRRPETYIMRHSGLVSPLSVDHDHATGAIRGLLCRACNSALGHLEDNEARLLSAIDYLRRHRG